MEGMDKIRVLDFSWLLPGPYATMLLADFGADVIKIEQPGRGDYTRETMSDMFAVVNRNKRSMTLDLKAEEGKAVVKRLVADADVVIEGYRPGVMKRLGLDYETLRAINPRIIYCSVTGYGQDGPYRDWAGHDIAYMAVGGGMSVPGDLKHPSVKGTIPIADLTSGMYAALSIQAALWDRLSSGKGQYIDVSMTDCVAALAAVRLANVLWNGKPPANRLSATSRVYDCGDGKRIALAVTEDAFWINMCTAMNRTDWLNDERFVTLEGRRAHALELLPQLEKQFMTKSRAEWLELFARHDVSAGPVHDADDVFEDPQIKSRNFIWQAERTGPEPRRMAGFPVKLERGQPTLRNVAPELGADTAHVLKEAGYDDAFIAQLKSKRVT